MIRWKYILISLGIGLCLCAAILAVYYLWEDNRAAKFSDELLQQVQPSANSASSVYDTSISSMSTGETKASEHVWAVLEIPKLGLRLPVWDTYSEEQLRKTPCRYGEEECQDGQFIFAGHNYQSHFGRLYQLQAEDIVNVSFMDGAQRQYRVTQVDEIAGTSRSQLFTGDWDLTLFTCDFSGQYRVLVRCVEIG